MTNAEKYLKDGASIDEIAEAYEKNCMNFNNFYIHTYSEEMRAFLRADCKPTLTEDERVILMNLSQIPEKISRDNTGDLVLTGKNYFRYFTSFNHIFQFIKEGEEYNIQDLLSND